MRNLWPALGLCFLIGCISLPAPDSQPEATLASDDALTLAADCLARGDESAAAGHFEVYVRAHPDQPMYRFHLANLLLKLHRESEARGHFTRFVADVQDGPAPLQAQLVHCHTKLMELSQNSSDRYGELLHRGIGLVLLAREASEDDIIREEILCQAIQSLREACELKPKEARAYVYLAEAHDRAGNRRAASVARATARILTMPGELTSSELRRCAPEER